MSESYLNPELTALEQALPRLVPQARLDRDAVLYRAGRASARGAGFWRVGACVSGLAAAVLGFLLSQRPDETTKIVEVDRIVEKVVPAPAPPEPPAPPAPSTPERTHLVRTNEPSLADQLRRRREVFRWGVDILPRPGPQVPGGDLLTPADAPRLAGELSLY